MNESKLIDLLGGTSRVSELTGLTTGAISQWKTNGIPRPWHLYFKARYPKIYKQATEQAK